MIISPDYADSTKFAAAVLAMGMGHVLLKEFFVDRNVPFFTD